MQNAVLIEDVARVMPDMKHSLFENPFIVVAELPAGMMPTLMPGTPLTHMVLTMLPCRFGAMLRKDAEVPAAKAARAAYLALMKKRNASPESEDSDN